MSSANSISPQPTATVYELDGSGWTRTPYALDGGVVTAGTPVTGAYPLNLERDGDCVNEVRVYGAGTLDLEYEQPVDLAYPIERITVADGEVLGARIRKVHGCSGPTMIRVAWGG